MRKTLMFCALALVVGCSGGSSVEGEATYVKPADEGGRKVAPQQRSDDLKVTVSLAGKANFEALDNALCQLTSGDFSSSVVSSGRIGSGGRYESSFEAEAGSDKATNPLCGALKEVEITSLTSVTVAASIPANEANCTAFCEARADQECSAGGDQASCRSELVAGCKADCQNASRITGTGSASASALAQTNGALGGGEVNATVDLVFSAFE